MRMKHSKFRWTADRPISGYGIVNILRLKIEAIGKCLLSLKEYVRLVILFERHRLGKHENGVMAVV